MFIVITDSDAHGMGASLYASREAAEAAVLSDMRDMGYEGTDIDGWRNFDPSDASGYRWEIQEERKLPLDHLTDDHLRVLLLEQPDDESEFDYVMSSTRNALAEDEESGEVEEKALQARREAWEDAYSGTNYMSSECWDALVKFWSV